MTRERIEEIREQMKTRISLNEKWVTDTLNELLDDANAVADLRIEGYTVSGEVLAEVVPDVPDGAFRCETCQNQATIYIETAGWHFCKDCCDKIDAQLAWPKRILAASEPKRPGYGLSGFDKPGSQYVKP